MWQRLEHRLALLELVASGSLRKRSSQSGAWNELVRLGWVRRTSRKDLLLIEERHRESIISALNSVWPTWAHDLKRLGNELLDATPAGWRELSRRERARMVRPAELPGTINQRTAAALVADHSKATLGRVDLETLGFVELTRDGMIRMRPHDGLRLRRGNESYAGSVLAHVQGEVVVTERALRDGTKVEGPPPLAILTVENVGAYVDLEPPANWLVVHVPGWNTHALRRFLDEFPSVPVVHFGDLDPNGMRIYAHLREMRPDIRLAIPDFWQESVAERGIERVWDLENIETFPPLVQRLARERLWLEQEGIVLDARLRGAFESLITSDAVGRGSNAARDDEK